MARDTSRQLKSSVVPPEKVFSSALPPPQSHVLTFHSCFELHYLSLVCQGVSTNLEKVNQRSIHKLCVCGGGGGKNHCADAEGAEVCAVQTSGHTWCYGCRDRYPKRLESTFPFDQGSRLTKHVRRIQTTKIKPICSSLKDIYIHLP